MAGKTFLGQQRQITTVIQVRVGQQHGINLMRSHWQRRPVAQSQLFVALKQAAIYQHTVVALSDQVLGACHGTGTTEECDADAHGFSLLLGRKKSHAALAAGWLDFASDWGSSGSQFGIN
jgi:hypothetical protein